YTLVMSWEPTHTYSFNPTNLIGFEIVPFDVQAPSTPDNTTTPPTPQSSASTSGGSAGSGSSGSTSNTGKGTASTNGGSTAKTSSGGGGGGCNYQTHVGAGYGSSAATASTDTSMGNVWKTYAALNYNINIYWYGDCGGGPPSYSAATGYAGDVRGPNQPARGGSYLMDIALTHKGGGNGYGSYDNWGWKSIYNQPWITLQKPSEGKVKLESSTVLGLNQNSCTSWPQTVQDALAAVPWNYQWSLITYFATRTYCSDNWQSLDSGGSSGDRSTVGFKITRDSQTGQLEHGGRITFRAGTTTGRFTMPFTYTQFVYGSVTAGNNNPASFQLTGPVTTSSAPAAQVV
ncbi:MAG: hypothetical protein LC623_09890, partial [Halobacteriales archaeon]|nr:hypothetical protein [Halobacteriales archaeon]